MEINVEFIKEKYGSVFERILKYSEGYEIYLAGGAIRDLVNTKPELLLLEYRPKDLDFLLVPVGDVQELPMIPGSYITFNYKTDDMPDTARRGVKQVVGVNTARITQECQFIVYEKHMTASELAADMDCNVNQVVMNLKDYEVTMTEAFVEGHESKTIKILHKFDEDRMVERLQRMSKRLEGYTVESDIDWKKKPKKRKCGKSSISMIN